MYQYLLSGSIGGIGVAAVLFATSLRADELKFFRITSPTNTEITLIEGTGWLTWTNAVASGTCIVQTATNLLATNEWQSHARTELTGAVVRLRVLHPAPPDGMVYIPAGLFAMGNAMGTNEGSIAERPLHEVCLDAFFIEAREVSGSLWASVRSWALTNGYAFSASAGYCKASDHPATSNGWYDCVKWCNARSEKEGLTPCYYRGPALTNVYRSGAVDVSNSWAMWNADGYRLPTEAEWEKAARGGQEGRRFPWGDVISHSNANYFSSNLLTNGLPCTYEVGEAPWGYHPSYTNGGEPYTSPIGSFSPNSYGLYDVCGNVNEWCWDWYSPFYYGSSPRDNPRGPASAPSPAYRVLRGGGWHATESAMMRCSYRAGNAPNHVTSNRGLRCVRSANDN